MVTGRLPLQLGEALIAHDGYSSVLTYLPAYAAKLQFGDTFLCPLPGTCFVEIFPDMLAQEKGIWLPDTAQARQRFGYVGTVLCENAINSPPSRRTLRGTCGRIFRFVSWAGQKFTYGGLDLIKYDLDLEHFVAVFFEGEWIPLACDHAGAPEPDERGLPRCRSCRSRGKGNIFLDGDGICPVCGRTRAGQPAPIHRYRTSGGETVQTHQEVKVSEEEREKLGWESPKNARGVVISAGRKVGGTHAGRSWLKTRK